METVNTEITIEEKSEYLSVVNWVIEHYPYDSVFTMSDISTHMSDLDEDDEEELDSMHKKVEFIYYRYSITDPDLEVNQAKSPSVKQSEDGPFFFITDPDNRRWKISYFPSR